MTNSKLISNAFNYFLNSQLCYQIKLKFQERHTNFCLTELAVKLCFFILAKLVFLYCIHVS